MINDQNWPKDLNRWITIEDTGKVVKGIPTEKGTRTRGASQLSFTWPLKKNTHTHIISKNNNNKRKERKIIFKKVKKINM